jgi:16S rRNA processing protein RimM
VTESGESLGSLVEILETGANDVYIVRPSVGADLLLPAIREVILDIDLSAGQILVRPLPGLLPEA